MSPRLLRRLAWMLITVALLVLVVAPNLDRVGTSFPGYWVVAREVLAGTPGVQLYDDAWLADRMAAHGFPGDRMLGPPSLALTLVPLAWLPYRVARAVWMLGVLVPALLGSLAWLSRRFSPRWGLFFVATHALSRPVADGMESAQVYPLMLALHCAALAGWEQGRARLGGLALAPMMALRGWHGLPQAVGWAVSGRWRGSAWALGGAVVLCLLSVPLLGAAAWVTFLTEQTRETVSSEAAAATAYQTWRSLALHLTTAHPIYSPDPPLVGLGPIPWLAGVAAIGAASLLAARRLGDHPVGFALWTLVALLLAPFAQDYHLVLSALPSAVIWAASPRLRPAVLVAWALLLPPWPFEHPAISGGWRSLLAYPRVAGLLVLWGCCLAAARRPEAPRATPEPT